MNQRTGVPPAGYNLVMCSFSGTQTASDVVHRLKSEPDWAESEIEGEALVSRDDDGRVHFHEKDSSGVGAAAGATAAGLVGMMGGPVILPLMLVAGAIVGGVAGHFMGQVLPQDDLREVGASLPPGSSAYIALVDSAHADVLADAFAAKGARVLNTPIETELSGAIREGVTHRIRRV